MKERYAMKKTKQIKDQKLIEVLTENSLARAGEIIHVGSINNSGENTSLRASINKALDQLKLLVVLLTLNLTLLFILIVSIWK